MRHLRTYKLFENIETIQQPFFVSKGGVLYISQEITDKIVNKYGLGYINKHNKTIHPKLYVGIRNSKNDIEYKLTVILYNISAKLNDAGKFPYKMGGNSGDSVLWGTGRWKFGVNGAEFSGDNLIKIFYPIWEYIPRGYKRLRKGELFFDIINSELEKKPELVKYGIPSELKDKWGDLEDMEEIGLL